MHWPEASEKDMFVWLDGRKGFTVKATYELSKSWNDGDSWMGWRRIWKAKVQQRIRIFMWLMSHGRILTNAERQRNLSLTDVCAGVRSRRKEYCMPFETVAELKRCGVH